MKKTRVGMVWLTALLLSASATQTAAESADRWLIKSDRVLAENAVAASWIGWKSPNLPDADLVYVDRSTWDICVMDQNGGHKRSLTRPGKNALGVDFPLDKGRSRKSIRWKGDPEAHPTNPIILFKAENEHSPHLPRRNTPSIGWENDLWALNVQTRRYQRLTHLAKGEGLQHSAISEDGAWYVYPRRYDIGHPPRDFGFASMVFNRLSVDGNGDLHLERRFEIEPLGRAYYEPNDIQLNPSGTYTLYYGATTGTRLDPYSYEWSCPDDRCRGTNTILTETPDTHEEFFMVSPSGRYLTSMRGPQVRFRYLADLYISRRDFSAAQRITWYNDCKQWPDRCKPNGVQLSRLEWRGDGRAIFYGLWIHGPLLPFRKVELHRLDFMGDGDGVP